MLLEYFHHSSDSWSQYAQKVVFDGVNKIVTVNTGVTSLSIRADLYSSWVWWISTRDNSKFLPAMRYTGLDIIPGGFTGDTYFLINDWKLVIDLTKVALSGVLFSDDYATAFYTPEMEPVYPATVSSLVMSSVSYQNVVTGDLSTLPSAAQIVAAILAAAQTTPIHADTRKMNGSTVNGDGSAGNLWRGA